MKKKKNNIPKFIFYLLFFSFLIIYFSEISGYYEYQNYKKKELTLDQINKFEEDVKKGHEVDINDYLVNTEFSYNNKLSNLTSKMSLGISKIVLSGVEGTFKFLSNLIDE